MSVSPESYGEQNRLSRLFVAPLMAVACISLITEADRAQGAEQVPMHTAGTGFDSQSLQTFVETRPSPGKGLLPPHLGNLLTELDEIAQPADSEQIIREVNTLYKSSVQIAFRQKAYGNEQPQQWLKGCSGNFVKFTPKPQLKLVTTSAHCLDGIETISLLNNLAGNAAPPAVNIPLFYNREIGIVPAGHEISDATVTHTIGKISVSTSGQDAALLWLKPTRNKEAQSLRRNMRQIPLRFTQPQPGETAVSVSSPPAAKSKPVVMMGTYTNTTGATPPHLESSRQRVLRVITDQLASPESDGCNFGSSGSSAVIINPNGTKTSFTGPLSTRQNLGYTHSDRQEEDKFYTNTNNKRIKRNITGVARFIGSGTGVNPPRYTTECSYTELTRKDYTALIRGFGTPIIRELGKYEGSRKGGQEK